MITLAELKLQSRNRADMKNSNFVDDAELRSYINNSISELYDLMCEAYGEDYYVESYEFSTTGATEYTLPADFYELKGVDIKADSQDYIGLQRFNFNERNRLQNSSIIAWGGINSVQYRLLGNKIRLAPTPPANTTIRVWYVPLPEQLVDDTDELEDFNAYSEYVIVDAAIKMMQKEESDVQVLMLQKQALKSRIQGKAMNRDVANSESITDVHVDDWYPFRGIK